MKRVLDVYFGDAKAGILSQNDEGMLSYAYDPDYLGGPEPRAISFSMPTADFRITGQRLR